MGVFVGVGGSDDHDADAAGREAGQAAMAALGGRAADLVLAFATTGHDQAALLAAVRAATGGAPLTGCSGSGVITQQGSREGSHVVGVVAIAAEGLRATTFLARGAADDARGCAHEVASQLRAGRTPAARGEDRVVLLFTDGLTTNCGELLAGLRAELPGLPIAGGSAGDAFTFEHTYQYRDGEAATDSVAGVLLAGDLSTEIAVSHGCEPLGIEQIITRAEGGWVYEIGGRPAWSFFKEYVDEGAEGLDALNIAYLCLAERLPEELHAEYGELIIRVPIRLDKDTGALFFPAGLETGARVHVALRRAEAIAARAVESARKMASRRGEQRPSLVLQFDCVGRGRLLFGEGTTDKLIDPVQRVFGKDVPWLGLHTYGELAPIGGLPYFHNFTAVFLALYAGKGTERAR